MSNATHNLGRRVLITGAAGLIGSSLARQFLDQGWQVTGVDDFSSGWPERLPADTGFRFVEGDVGQPGLLRELLQQGQPFEALVHLAARVGVRSILRDPEGCRNSNLRGVESLLRALEALPDERQPRIYAASTSEVYAESRGPLKEGDPTRASAGKGRWAYAGSKLRGEELLDAATRSLSPARQPVHLRFFNVVGPGQDAQSGMVLANFVERALAGEQLVLHGDGSQVRTFGHVDEIALALSELIGLGNCTAGPLNVGGQALTTIGDLARLVLACSHSKSRLESTDPKRDCGPNFEGIAYREPDLSRLARLGVSLPQASLESIVRDTLARHLAQARPLTRAALCVSPEF